MTPMARRKEKPAAPPPDRTLLDFSTDFFTLFGAQITELEANSPQGLEVDLPPELVDHFGGPHLSLYFHGGEPRPGQELMAHGSRIFDRMLTLLEGRSAFTLLRLPQRVTGGEALLGALKPLNASIRDLRVQEGAQWLFVFHWRITYRADDKRQELYSVVVDEDGARVPLLGEELPAGSSALPVDLARLLVGEVTEVYAAGSATARRQYPDADVFDVSLATLRFAGGAAGSIASTCLLAWPHRIGLHLFGDTLAIELAEREMSVRTGGYATTTYTAQVDSFLREDRAFIDAVQGKENHIRISYAEAIKTHRVTTAAERSARSGQVVRLEGKSIHG